jgi:predicted ATPase
MRCWGSVRKRRTASPRLRASSKRPRSESAKLSYIGFRAICLNAASNRFAAEEHYRKAIAVAARQSARLFQLRASVSLARLWRDQGKPAEARDLLGPIYNWFTEGFDAPDLKNAKATLDDPA